LPCYLNDPSNINIAGSIAWCFSPGTCPSYPGWPVSAQNQLMQAFYYTVAWYNNGMTNYGGPLSPDPPNNPTVNAYATGQVPWPDLYPDEAFRIYVEHVAVSLAAEIYQWVPWGLHDYDGNGQKMGWVLDGLLVFSTDVSTGYALVYVEGATPGNAITTFKFLKSNNLIGPTRLDTIGRVLDWARSNLWHFNGTFSPEYYFYNWQYYGYPPVSRIISGTPDLNPAEAPLASPPHHWTAGCIGTSAFLMWVLKAVNIPVQPIAAGGHTTPWFISEDLFLSHGDDPYNALSKAGYPATYLLVSRDDFEAWFGPNNSKPIAYSGQNVGRKPVDLAVLYPTSNWLLYRYCDDVANNRDHASGRVYNETFNSENVSSASAGYTVTYLEELGLWDRLAAGKDTLGCPTSPY